MRPALTLVLCLASASLAHAADVCPGHLLTVEADGTASAGSKERVRQAVRAGLPLRIGWFLGGSTDERRGVAHWSEAGFVSEFGGEVFAQLADIQKQVPQRDAARIALDKGRWAGILGTNGSLEGFFEHVEGAPPPAVKVRSMWCVDARACQPSWRAVYRHDADGKPVAGAKDALFDAVRRGRPLRLAWGAKVERAGAPVSVEHAADPVFVTIVNGTDLFAQLPEHIGQSSYFEAEKARFDKTSVMWRGLLGTTGAFDAAFVDRATGAEVRRLPQRAAVAWFALAPSPLCDADPPLTLAAAGGVRLDPR
jgi:hypothetical protein